MNEAPAHPQLQMQKIFYMVPTVLLMAWWNERTVLQCCNAHAQSFSCFFDSSITNTTRLLVTIYK